MNTDIQPDAVFGQICECIGWSVCCVQSFDDALAKFTVLAFDLEPDVAHDKAIAMLEGFKRKTLGGLIKEFQKRVSLPSDFEERLTRFRDERNWLAHRSYTDVVPIVYGGEDAVPLLRRIVAVGREAQELTVPFWVDAAGMSNAYEYLRRNADMIPRVKDMLNATGPPGSE